MSKTPYTVPVPVNGITVHVRVDSENLKPALFARIVVVAGLVTAATLPMIGLPISLFGLVIWAFNRLAQRAILNDAIQQAAEDAAAKNRTATAVAYKSL